MNLRTFLPRYIYSVEYGRVTDTVRGHDDASEFQVSFIDIVLPFPLMLKGFTPISQVRMSIKLPLFSLNSFMSVLE
jgi:hypothetical protein